MPPKTKLVLQEKFSNIIRTFQKYNRFKMYLNLIICTSYSVAFNHCDIFNNEESQKLPNVDCGGYKIRDSRWCSRRLY